MASHMCSGTGYMSTDRMIYTAARRSASATMFAGQRLWMTLETGSMKVLFSKRHRILSIPTDTCASMRLMLRLVPTVDIIFTMCLIR